jgi:hypothetical protein
LATDARRRTDSTLRVLDGAWPNFLAEAELHRCETSREDQNAEKHQDDDNRALAAFCYLIAARDARKLARKPKLAKPTDPSALSPGRRPWLCLHSEALWTRIY